MVIKGEDIGLLISKPYEGVENQLEDLNKLVKKYPYCSSLYFIQLKIKATNNHVDFEDQLKLAAAHVPDREHLYQLINSDQAATIKTEQTVKTNESKKETVTTTDVKEVEPLEVENLEPEISSESELVSEELNSSTESIKENKETISEAINLEFTAPVEEIANLTETSSEETEKLAEEETKTEAANDSFATESSLDEEILSHAIGVAFEHSAETIISENLPETNANDEQVILEDSRENSSSTSQEISFIEWLNLKKKNGENHSVQGEIKTEIIKQQEIEKEKSTINDLLDKFISEEPRISAPIKDFYSPSANAKKSLEESADIVSETLAKIHEMQGNYKKAISAYKQLILLYPEKKVFFASRIEKIIEKQSL